MDTAFLEGDPTEVRESVRYDDVKFRKDAVLWGDFRRQSSRLPTSTVAAEVEEGNPINLIASEIDNDGEVLDNNENVVGRVDIAEGLKEEAEQKPRAQEEDGVQGGGEAQNAGTKFLYEKSRKPVEPKSSFDIVRGKKLDAKGDIIDDDGNILANLIWGDPKTCAGKVPDENGWILDIPVGFGEVSHAKDEMDAMDAMIDLDATETDEAAWSQVEDSMLTSYMPFMSILVH